MIRELIQSVTGYPGLFVFCAISGLLIPLPEDFSLIYGGMRIAESHWAWAPTLLVAIAGVLVRDVIAFGIGRTLGGYILGTGRVRHFVGATQIDRAKALVTRYGAQAVLGGRFLVGFRASVFLVAGAMGVSLRAFVGWDLVGLVVAVPLTVSLGYLFGEPVADLTFWALQRTRVVVGVLVVVSAAWLWWRMRTANATVRAHGENITSGESNV